MEPLMDPNLNAAVYRDMTAADRPPVPDKNLQFISIYNEKSAILGGSNMTDRYWCGTVWYFNDISDFDKNKAVVATKTESGVCDGAHLEHDKFVICEDSGVLQVLGLVDVADTNLQELQSLGYACLHDSSLLTLSVFHDNDHLVTGGMDYCIKVWDIEELIATHSFGFAHTDIVTCVNVQPRNSSVFVSTSFDCEALMWDIRQSKPAQSILKRDIGLTAVSWNSIADHIIAIGADNGDIVLVDVRKSGGLVLVDANMFHRSVHKLLFNPNPERSKELACCCDDIIVEVLNKDNFSSIYKNESHTDFIRGLAWYKDQLFSCSWDNTVGKHTIPL
ncbi:PREDICTED: methylosome protein 50-like [Dufourea novaeangliae]|uniref:Methylosome protein 50 n=1 Tax=Dufourea novaeangliae TaxID=178035 RepID=A0A154PLA0_DUFNO|nr:PREDICTED: methylosome protein 50-like [Dufourea novaeangliae]KZC12058.1 Methylosome protein 50 [Dufourea novaeangliae]